MQTHQASWSTVHYPHNERMFPSIQLDPILLQIISLTSQPPAVHHDVEPGSIFSIISS